MESAKATRAIYVSCLTKAMPTLKDVGNNGSTTNHQSSILPLVLKSVRECMEAALSMTEEVAMPRYAIDQWKVDSSVWSNQINEIKKRDN
jgi:hypothetical protein